MKASLRSRIGASGKELQRFCRRHHIRRMSLFGSVLRSDFGAQSDLDVLVEFDPENVPGLEFVRMRDELSHLLGRPVDLRTPASLSPHYRDEVLREAELVYAAA
jgi:predicted nucleotidyltransferase